MDASPPQVGVWAEEETRLAEGLLVAFPRPADFLPPQNVRLWSGCRFWGVGRYVFFSTCPALVVLYVGKMHEPADQQYT